jgi:hypothetical protein
MKKFANSLFPGASIGRSPGKVRSQPTMVFCTNDATTKFISKNLDTAMVNAIELVGSGGGRNF